MEETFFCRFCIDVQPWPLFSPTPPVLLRSLLQHPEGPPAPDAPRECRPEAVVAMERGAVRDDGGEERPA